MKYPDDYINHVICGDCFEVMKGIPDEVVDLIVIDPPYLVTKESWDKEKVVTGDLSKELSRILKKTGNLYVWCGIGEKSWSLIRWFPIFSKNFYFKDLIVWKKRRGKGMRKGWLFVREEIMWFVKDNEEFIWIVENQYNKNELNKFQKGFFGSKCLSKFKRYSNVWTDILEVLGNKNIGHYTPKPINALERILQVHTKEEDIVLDCFLGSGTTAVAAQKLGRRFIGIEIDPKYCKIARKRLEFGKQMF